MLEVGEILVPSGRAFVGLQVIEADDSHGDAAERRDRGARVARVEIDSGHRREDLDPNGRDSQPNDLVGPEKELARQLRTIETRQLQHSDERGRR